MSNVNSPRSKQKFVLHPLIHTRLFFKLVQDVEKKGAEPKTPHFLSLNQDFVAWSQEQKWELKYVIHSFDEQLQVTMDLHRSLIHYFC